MTFLEAIQEANTAARIQSFRFANIREFNSFMESFQFSDYPINIVVPFSNNGKRPGTPGALRKSNIPLQGWILTRIDDEQDAEDYRSAKVESKYIEPMRALAVSFLTNLLETDVIDPEVSEVTDSINPEYAFLKQRAFGVSYTMNVPVIEHVC